MVKSGLLVLALVGIIGGCRSFDQNLVDQKVNVDKRFSTYSVFVDADSLKSAFPDSHYDNKYRDSVQQMLLNRMQLEGSGSGSQGYISIIVREVELRDERLWAIGFPLMVFGLPYQRIDAQINLDFALMNKQGKIIRVFSVEGRSDVLNGLFYGYSDFRASDSPADTPYAKTAIFKSLDRAMIDAKIQLAYLASKLEEEGK